LLLVVGPTGREPQVQIGQNAGIVHVPRHLTSLVDGAMNKAFESNRISDWCTWAACGVATLGGVVVISAPAGGSNRVLGVAVALAVGAAMLAASALTTLRMGWLNGLLYATAALAMLYGMLLALSLPLRLAVEGACRPAPAPCPLGFDHPQTSGETFAVYAVVMCAALALVLIFVAIEVRYIRKPRPTQAPPKDPPS